MLLRDGVGRTDGQLLESFLSGKDEAAFEVLVRRHGPMVLGVCRRVLRNHHDAENAFQATFLVLVRKAGSIVPRQMLPNWLYGVACRTAMKASSMLARQRVRERQVTEMPEPEAAEPDDYWRDLKPLLDQELSRLPDKYRVPVVLCDLEGKTGKEAACQLGWPEGTVSSRLSRGRLLLAKRLAQHGVALPGGSLAVMLAGSAASASVPTSLVSTTVKAASLLAAGQVLATGLVSAKVATLTEGVLRAMFLNRVKITLAVLAVIGVVGTGVGGVSYRAAANDKPAVPSRHQQVAQAHVKQPKAVRSAPDKVEGPGKREKGEKKETEKSQANQVLDMVLKGFQAYQETRGKKGEPSKKDALDLYGEAFLKAFRVSSAIAKAMGKGQARLKPEARGAIDAYGPAFVQAYERAKNLKKALEEQKAADGKGSDRAIEALDVFLKAGKEFEQAIKQRVKAQGVDHAKKEIEIALSRVAKTARDKRTEQETLDEIERAVQRMKKKLQERKDGK
jgi:RNA polymerase sigma factor (sigma-70 family)